MKLLPLILILFTVSYAAAAQFGETPVSYDFGEIIIGDMDIDGLPYDTTFIAGGGEISANENIFFSIYYRSAIISESNVTATDNQFTVGLGYHDAMTAKCDFVVGCGVIFDRADIKVNNITLVSTSDTGYFLSAGVRAVPTPGLEIGLDFSYVDLYDDLTTSFNTSAKYFFGDGKFGLGVLYQTSSDVDLIGMSLTWKSK